jgi:GNAT superfamily N-acetyltransferase
MNRWFASLEDVVYRQIDDKVMYIDLSSYINDKWHNFLRFENSLVSDEVEKLKSMLVEKESTGDEFSLNVVDKFLGEYEQQFIMWGYEKIGSDVLLVRDLEGEGGDDSLRGEMVKVVSRSENEKLLKGMVDVCFEGWDKGGEYVDHFLSLDLQNGINDLWIYVVDGREVGFCGMAVKNEVGDVYLHCTGVMSEYRGKGYFRDMVNYRMGLAAKKGYESVFAFVEFECGSHYALEKMGFKLEDKSWLFAKGE